MKVKADDHMLKDWTPQDGEFGSLTHFSDPRELMPSDTQNHPESCSDLQSRQLRILLRRIEEAVTKGDPLARQIASATKRWTVATFCATLISVIVVLYPHVLRLLSFIKHYIVSLGT